MALYKHGQAWTLHRCVGPVSGHGHAGLNGTVSVLFRARSGQLLCQDIPYSAIVKPECEQQARMIEVTGFEMRATSNAATRKTARLSLRLPEAQDINFTADLFSRKELVAHRPDPHPDAPEESAARLARDMAHWKDHGFGRWTALADGNLVGFGGVTVSKEFDGPNLSYHLHPDYWGHGFATELVTEAVRFAFEDVGIRRVIGLVRPANPAARRVLERCGFSFEREVMLHGAPTNLYVRER